jgi:ribosomal protein S18 acetylase RimI-like enzyme
MRPGEFLRNQFRLYRLWILERELDDVATTVRVQPPERIQMRFLDRHERRDWICDHAPDKDWPQFRAALKHEHDLLVASEGDSTVGWAWIGYERVFLPPLGREIRLADGTAYLYEAYVRPAARGRGIGRMLVGARCLRATEHGCERSLTHVVDGNLASLRALQAHGFETRGRTLFVKALGLTMWTQAPLPERSLA